MSGRRIAITGASGFIGRYLVEAIAQSGDTPVALTRTEASFPAGTEMAMTDYSLPAFELDLAGVDTLVHLAGRRMTREDDPHDLAPFLAPNVALIGDAFTAAKTNNLRRFIFASTIAVYSQADPMPYRETGSRHPVNAYALSKKMAEDYLAMRIGDGGMTAVALRLAATYGHGEKATPALMKFADRAGKGLPLILKGNPHHRIDQIYVRDAVTAILAAIDAPSVAGAINIGGGVGPTVEEIARAVNRVWENEGNIDLTAADPRPEAENFMDISRAAEVLGWRPEFDLDRGLADFRIRRAADNGA